MVRLFHGNIDFIPLWRPHTSELVDFPTTSLLPQILGAIWSLEFSILFFAGSSFADIIHRLELPIPLMLRILSTPLFVIFIAFIISLISTTILLYYGSNFEVKGFKEISYAYRELDNRSPLPIILDVLFGVLLGIVIGFIAFIALGIPSYFFGIFFFYFFVVFLPIDIAIVMGFTSAIFISAYSVIFFRGRIYITESEYTLPLEYKKTERVLEIEKSGKDPIICQSCRSFISADSDECPVCYDPIVP